MPTPLLGDLVIYRSRTGDYSLAAIVTATVHSINPVGVERGQVPPLSTDAHVHLAVFTPGLPPVATPQSTHVVIDPERPLGKRMLPPDTELEDGKFLALTALGGTYAEFDIPLWDGDDQFSRGAGLPPYGDHLARQAPGTWARRLEPFRG